MALEVARGIGEDVGMVALARTRSPGPPPSEEEHMRSRISHGVSRTGAGAGLVIASLILAACGTATTSTAPSAAASSGAASSAASAAAPSTGAASAAASTSAGASAAAPSAAASAASGTIQSMKVAGAGPVLTLDVTKSGDLVSVDTIILTQGALYRSDKNGVPKPELVDTLTTSPDGKTVTIKLKAGQKYSDGTPVTAKDVKAAVDHQLNNAKAGDPPTPGANKIFINSVK